MDEFSAIERMWSDLDQSIKGVRRQSDLLSTRTERAETAGGVPSVLLADAPLAATGGVSDGLAYIDVLWIRNGRKPTEGAGAGTGVLAVYSAPLDAWLRVGDYASVTT